MSLVSSHGPASYSAVPTNHCCVWACACGACAGRSASLSRSEREGPRSWRRLLANHIITKERTIEDGEERREGGGGGGSGGGGKEGEEEEEKEEEGRRGGGGGEEDVKEVWEERGRRRVRL